MRRGAYTFVPLHAITFIVICNIISEYEAGKPPYNEARSLHICTTTCCYIHHHLQQYLRMCGYETSVQGRKVLYSTLHQAIKASSQHRRLTRIERDRILLLLLLLNSGGIGHRICRRPRCNGTGHRRHLLKVCGVACNSPHVLGEKKRPALSARTNRRLS